MGPAEFMALSRFTVANGMEDEVKEAFRDRPHLVDGAAGFVRMEVLSPVDGTSVPEGPGAPCSPSATPA